MGLLDQLSEFDRLKGHPLRQVERIGEIKHACPECPAAGARTPAGLILNPSSACPWCAGSGLVDEPTLDRWQQWVMTQPAG